MHIVSSENKGMFVCEAPTLGRTQMHSASAHAGHGQVGSESKGMFVCEAVTLACTQMHSASAHAGHGQARWL